MVLRPISSARSLRRTIMLGGMAACLGACGGIQTPLPAPRPHVSDRVAPSEWTKAMENLAANAKSSISEAERKIAASAKSGEELRNH